MIEHRAYYILTWESPPRPPAHMNSMIGKQSFKTVSDAVSFFSKRAPDNVFMSLERVTELSEDFSEIFNKFRVKEEEL